MTTRFLSTWVVGSLFVGVVAAAAPTAAAVDAMLAEAQRLYEAADYEQALDVLARVEAEHAPLPEQQSRRRYLALCLIALGRAADAERPVEEMVRAEPALQPERDLPPRLLAMIAQTRQRVSRSLVRDSYERGRALYDTGDRVAAARAFAQAVALIDDPTLALSEDSAFADLRVVADGFRALASAPLPPPAAAGTTPAGSAAAVSAAFIPPRPIAQPVPPLNQSLGGYMNRREGELELEIGADGTVRSAIVRVPTLPSYDALLVATAKSQWRYQPATRGGVAVAHRMRVRFVLQGR
jgi:tetratricopeptide (TPR) repeat protein